MHQEIKLIYEPTKVSNANHQTNRNFQIDNKL